MKIYRIASNDDTVYIYSKNEMLQMGADGHLTDAVLLNIPLDKIDGRDPIPADYVDEKGNVSQFRPGKKINVPIEVEWNNASDTFVLYGGNHRVRQAEINGDSSIIAFVQADDVEEYSTLLRNYMS